MDTNHLKSVSSIIGKANTGSGSKLKGGNSLGSSPGNTNFNNCTKSTHSMINNNGRRSVSPFYSADSKSDELLSKKGQSASIPSIHASGFPALSSSPPISTTPCIPPLSNAVPTKRDGSKPNTNASSEARHTNSPYLRLPSPNEMKGNTASSRKEILANRSEKSLPANHVASGDRNQSLRNPGKRNTFMARRHNSVECPGGFSPTNSFKNMKGPEKTSLHQSPRGDFFSDSSGRNQAGYQSPSLSYPSPSSSENALTPGATSRGKNKTGLAQDIGPATPASSVAPSHISNHLSRTSSSNSISDLSRCSEVADDVAHTDGTTTLPGDTLTTRTTTSPGRSVCQMNMESTMHFTQFDDDRAIVDALGTLTDVTEQSHSDKIENPTAINAGESISTEKLALNLDGDFQFPDDDNGPADIGQKALNLSAEDVRQTLNSVSAESDLPDLGSDANVFEDNSAMLMSNSTDFNASSESFPAGDASRVISPSAAVSVAVSTSPTTSIVTTAVNSVPTTLPSTSSTLAPNAGSFGSDVFPSGSSGQSFQSTQNSSTMSSTSVSFSGAGAPGSGMRSHLQDILGVTDTDRLKKMGQPVDSSQYNSVAPTTSFNPNIPQPGQVMPNSSTGPVQNLPSSQFNRLTSPTGNNSNLYQRSPVFHPRNHPYGGQPHPMMGYEHPGMHPGAFMDGPRTNMPYDPRMSPHHHPGPGNVPFGQGPPWQGPSPGSMMPPPEGNKSPRGQMGPSYAHRPMNPMTGLQSTVNSIPEAFPTSHGIGSMTKNNNNNMGPPNSYQGMPQMSNNDFPVSLSPMSRTMLPPQSPSIQSDKMRSVSADSSASNTTSLKRSNKRERGQSVDSKDGEKQSGPKSKRRKSRSKDDSKKATTESKSNSRSTSVNETQANNQLVYIFNSEVANAAASMISQGKAPTMVSYHQTSQRNCRLMPSNVSSLPSSKIQPQEGHVTRSGVARGNSQGFMGHPQNPQMPGHHLKSEPNLTSPRPARENGKSKDSTQNKSEFDASGDSNIAKPSPPVSKQNTTEETLTEEQMRHRQDSLNKIKSIGNIFLGQDSNPNAAQMPPANNRGQDHYEMTRHLQEFQKNNPVSAQSVGPQDPSKEWLRLVQAYNEHKKQIRHIHHMKPDGQGVDLASPPPYHPGGNNPVWMGPGPGPGPGMRDPTIPMGPGHEMINPRFPHHMAIRPNNPGRMPYDGGAPVPRYVRTPRGYIGPGGAGVRMPIYTGGGIPPGGVMVGKGQRPPVSRLPQHMSHSNEAYPFSEKLKEKASLYRTDGMHAGQGGNVPFDMNNPDVQMGPEWSPYSGIPPGPGGRLSHMPETVSPSHMPIGPGMMMSSAGPVPGGPPMEESRLTPGMDPGLRMANPAMAGPNFPHPLPNYTDSPMPGMAPHSMASTYVSQEMRPPSNPMGGMPQERPSGNMVDAMERRGEPRPPDLKISASTVPRSPLSYAGARHPLLSPGMANPAIMGPGSQPPFMHNEFGTGSLPQVSPHPNSVPRSPMNNSSPGGAQFMGMGPGGPVPGPMQHQLSVDHPNMMPPSGPLSAEQGPNPDWVPPASMAPPRTPSSAGVMIPNQGPRPQSAITEMMHKMSSFPLSMPSPLYQDAIKDTSPPPLSHLNGNAILSHEPPPLTHNPNADPGAMMPSTMGPTMIRAPARQMMSQMPPGAPPGYDPGIAGPRSAGPRQMVPHPGDGYMVDYHRPPSHPSICMSPSMQASQQGMMGPNPEMDMRNYMPHNSAMAGPPGNMQMMPGGMRRIPEFDLTHIIPREKPSETLSYFPPNDRGGQETSQADPGASNQPQPGRSPTAMQPPMPRYPNSSGMAQRPMTPGSSSYPGNPTMRPMGVPGNFGPSNPPNYPPDSYMYHMSGRPPMMNSGPGPGMHSGYSGGRTLM